MFFDVLKIHFKIMILRMMAFKMLLLLVIVSQMLSKCMPMKTTYISNYCPIFVVIAAYSQAVLKKKKNCNFNYSNSQGKQSRFQMMVIFCVGRLHWRLLLLQEMVQRLIDKLSSWSCTWIRFGSPSPPVGKIIKVTILKIKILTHQKIFL